MKNMKIAGKLIVSLLSITVMLMIVDAVGIFGVRSVDKNLAEFYETAHQNTVDLDLLGENLNMAAKNMLHSVVDEDPEVTEKRLSMAAEEFELLFPAIERLKASYSGDMTDITETERLINEIYDYSGEFKILAKENDIDGAYAIYNTQIANCMAEAYTHINAARAYSTEQAAGLYEEGEKDGDKTVAIIAVIGSLGLICAAGFSAYLIIFFGRTIRNIRDSAAEMAKGNFNINLSYESRDELGQLSEDMRILCQTTKKILVDLAEILQELENANLAVKTSHDRLYVGEYAVLLSSLRNFLAKINEAMHGISDASDQVLSGAEQVSNGAQSLSQGATEQASSVEELAATMQVIGDKVQENEKSAQEAMAKTTEANAQVDSANEEMAALMNAMKETQECSDKIGKIIKSIEDIAFQTNILALNAAVEAARAGAAGKGFAVVADEVRNLASKSAEAAGNTNTLIEDTMNSIEKGVKLAQKVADSLDTVVKSTDRISEYNSSIVTASADLADSIAQVNSGIGQISNVVQTNAATAQESAAASEELTGQANNLNSLVGQFQLRNQ